MNTDLKTIYTGLTNGQHSSEENGIRGFYETAGLVKSYEYIFLPRLSSSPGREDFAILRRSRKRTQALVETNLPGILDQLIRPMVSPKTGISRELGVPVASCAAPQVTNRVIDCHA